MKGSPLSRAHARNGLNSKDKGTRQGEGGELRRRQYLENKNRNLDARRGKVKKKKRVVQSFGRRRLQPKCGNRRVGSK